ncbi:MAG: ComEC/Rec2 family competence protein [Verrucomicrobiota bacterium]|nr:ComEC/Rec2 family competence protein [Verrucomicrobiota bacterium]
MSVATLDKFFSKVPAFLPLVLWINGILLLTLNVFSESLLFRIFFLAVYTFISLLFIPKKHFFAYLLILLLGGMYSIFSLNSNYLKYSRFLPANECYGEIIATIIDPDETSQKISFVRGEYYRTAVLEKLRLNSDEKWKKCRGKIIIGNISRDLETSYNSRVFCKGAFLSPQKSFFHGDLDYASYLKTEGIDHVFRCVESQTRGKSTGIRTILSTLFSLRKSLMINLCNSNANIENEILSAIIFGQKQNLGKEVKKKYLKSGTYHFFAISGLHVGILGGIILFFLRVCFVDYHKRYLLLPIILSVYILMVGTPSSAVRAWIMISVWSMGKFLKKPVSSLNNVCISALILLIYNPLYIYRIGFQFSFIIVLFIVLVWPLISSLENILFNNNPYLPSPEKNRLILRFCFKYIFRLICIGIVCNIAASGLIAFYSGYFLPFSFICNSFLAVFAWGVIFLSIIKIISVVLLGSCFWGVEQLLSFLIMTINSITGIFSAHFFCYFVRKPYLFEVIFFYITLFCSVICLKTGKSRMAVFFAIATILLVFSWHWKLSEENHLLVFTETSHSIPSILILPGDGLKPILVNTGNFKNSRTIRSYLSALGENSVKLIIALESKASSIGGLSEFLREKSVEKIILRENWRRSSNAKEGYIVQLHNNGKIKETELGNDNLQKEEVYSDEISSIKILSTKNVTKTELFLSWRNLNKFLKLNINLYKYGKTTITYSWNDELEKKIELFPINKAQIIKL